MNNDSAIVRRAATTLFVLLLVWMFASILFGPNILAYRDASHFFARLFQFTQDEWSAGRIPLWNPYNNAGTPLAANATSSVFYPAKLIFFLPLPFAWLYNVYVVSHVALAGFFAYRLSRKWDTSQIGAAICAISYAFSGAVLYQYANVIFLIGAAWLPAALWATDQMLREKSLRWSCALGAILAMVVLGGDAQMAYHIGLLAGLYAIIVWRCRDQEEIESRPPFHQRSLVLLGAAAICGLALSAIQVLPTSEWSRECVRGRNVLPRNIYQIPGYLRSDFRYDNYTDVNWYDELLGKNVNPSPSEPIYEYSLAPWRLTEFVWPWISGCSLSKYQRWIYQIAPERDWVPSLYMGLLPLVLVLIGWQIRGANARIKWMSIVLYLSLFASLGKFGLGWLLHARFGVGDDSAIGDPFGGFYWLMTTVLPGYSQFRWPAKWLVVTAMSASVLAGFGWDRVQNKEHTLRLNWILIVLFAASVIGAAAMSVSWTAWSHWADNSFDNSTFLGPFDATGAYQDVLFSFLFAACMSGVLWGLFRFNQKQPSIKWQLGLLVVVVVDLAIANRWMITTTPASQLSAKSEFSKILEQAEEQHGDGQPFRIFRGRFTPHRWQFEASPDRFTEFNDWSADSFYPMHHYDADVELINVDSDTLRNFDQALLMTTAGWVTSDGQPRRLQPRRALDALNTKYFIAPKGRTDLDGLHGSWREMPVNAPPAELAVGHPPFNSFDANVPDSIGDVEWIYNQDYLPRAWVVNEVRVVPKIDPRDHGRLVDASMQIGFSSGIDLLKVAIVESNKLADSKTVADHSTCQIVSYSPQRVEIDVELSQPGMLVMSDIYEKNWRAFQQDGDSIEPLEIHRTNRIMRGVQLEEGKHRVVFEYSPTSFYLGAWISMISWLLLIALCVRRKRR